MEQRFHPLLAVNQTFTPRPSGRIVPASSPGLPRCRAPPVAHREPAMRKITAALLLLSAFCVIILLVTRVLPQTQRQPVRRAKQTRPTPDRSAGRLNVETDIPDSEQDWRLATESDEKPSGDSMAVYYNKRTLTHPSPGIVRVWVKYVDVMNNERSEEHMSELKSHSFISYA